MNDNAEVKETESGGEGESEREWKIPPVPGVEAPCAAFSALCDNQ